MTNDNTYHLAELLPQAVRTLSGRRYHTQRAARTYPEESADTRDAASPPNTLSALLLRVFDAHRSQA